MRFSQQLLALLGAALPFAAALPAPAAPAQAEVIPGKYIVTLKQDLSASAISAHTSWVSDKLNLANLDPASAPTGIEHTYTGPFTGYAGTFDPATLTAIRNNPAVAAVEADQVWHLYSTQDPAPYGLGSISTRNPGSTRYDYDSSAGFDTWAYVVDTGINTAHVEFEGRASFGFNAVGGTDEDTNGHGTHCAGTIASRAYGVAKRANVIAVKVFAGSSGSTSTVLSGFNWAVNDILANGRQNLAVISMSLGGGYSAAFNEAVASAYSRGVTSVVAAGNSNADASGFSPASAPQAITVGAHDSNWVRSGFSNYGGVVDVFAAGTNVLSTWIGSTTASRSISGTSMATPHIAGLALYFQRFEGYRTPDALANRIISIATTGRLQNPGPNSPNRIANNGYFG